MRATGREDRCYAFFSSQSGPAFYYLDNRRPYHRVGRDRSPPNAFVYIISPKEGETVTNPFRVQFGLSSMGVAPAGVDRPNTGHHHLLIDVNEPLDPNEPIPQDKTHLHFGAGQTEALIELTPGKTYTSASVGGLVASSVPSARHVRRHYRQCELIRPNRRPHFACCSS